MLSALCTRWIVKIVYAYGRMFVLHSSGHVDSYDKDDIEAQQAIEQELKSNASARIEDITNRLKNMDATISDLETEPVKEGLIARFIRRLKDDFR